VSFQDLTPRSTTGNVPVIGDLIPSRWAYEALAVTSFTDNRYERLFFDNDREKYETQYYNAGMLYELQSQLETMKDEQQRGAEVKAEHLKTIQANLPRLTGFCGMAPYSGDYSYESLNACLKEAESILNKRANLATLRGDRMMGSLIQQHGKEALLQLKRDNYNLKLDDMLAGAEQGRLLDVVDNIIVPRAGLVFLTPENRLGRAPFYSSVKIIGPWQVKTMWFNLAVMLLMSVIVIVLLITKLLAK
jgi:hypothetical protein